MKASAKGGEGKTLLMATVFVQKAAENPTLTIHELSFELNKIMGKK